MRPAGSTPSDSPRTALRAAKPRSRKALGAVAAVAAVAPVASTAHAAGGGGVSLTPSAASLAQSVIIRKITCEKGCSSIAAATPGATLRFQGPMIALGKRVVYLGAKGTADDVLAKLSVHKTRAGQVLTALVPRRAVSGPLAIEIKAGARSKASAAEIALPQALPVAAIAPLPGAGPFFPIVGAYELGTGSAAFGGGRGHEGQDVFAKCGTPLVAAEGGKVLTNAFESRAGNYLVIDVAGGDHDEAYMHLQAPAIVKEGDDVAAGAPIGNVGDTGHADGCHLHFELWMGNWQGVGGAGHPIDPLPTLKAWAALAPGVKTVH